MSQLVGTAGLWGAWGVAEYERHSWHEQALAKVQADKERWPAHYAQQRQEATQQAILDQLRQLSAPPD